MQYQKNIPQTMFRPTKLPWINHNIKKQTKQCKVIQYRAKHLQTEEAWLNYRNTKLLHQTLEQISVIVWKS